MGALPPTVPASVSCASPAGPSHSAITAQCAHILCSHFPTSTPTVSAADASKLATRPAVEVGPLLLIFITIVATIALVAYIALFDTGAAISTINSQALARLPE